MNSVALNVLGHWGTAFYVVHIQLVEHANAKIRDGSNEFVTSRRNAFLRMLVFGIVAFIIFMSFPWPSGMAFDFSVNKIRDVVVLGTIYLIRDSAY